MILEGFSDTNYILFIFLPNFLNLTVLASRNFLRNRFSKFSIIKKRPLVRNCTGLQTISVPSFKEKQYSPSYH